MNRHTGHEHGCFMTRRSDDRQEELDKVHSKSRACAKSRAHSKSKAHSKSRTRSKSKAHQDEKGSHMHSPILPSHSHKQLRARNRHDAEHLVPSAKEQSKHDKLKEEVVKQSPRVYPWACPSHCLHPNL